jgi:syntaxin 1B/2/3
MNDLLSGSFKTSVADGSSPPHSHNIEMSKAKVSGGSCHGRKYRPLFCFFLHR